MSYRMWAFILGQDNHACPIECELLYYLDQDNHSCPIECELLY
jgi:hypothetical protein